MKRTGRSDRRAGRWILPLLALCLLGAGALTAVGAEKPETIEPFTGVTVYDEEFSIEPYLGKVPIVLDFGSIYCSSCVRSIPDLIVLQNKYSEDQLKVVGLNLDSSGLSRVKRFFSTFRKSLNFPIVLDRKMAVAKQLGIVTLPTYVILDKEGNVAARLEGFDAEVKRRMEKIIDKLVKGEALEVAEEKFEQDVVVLAPENFTMTTQGKLFVVGKTGGHPGPFHIRLNGGSERKAEVSGEMFVARMPLSLGSNFLEVRYPKGDAMSVQAVVVFRQPRMGDEMGMNFPPYQFHMEEKEETCAPCHDMKPDPENIGPMSGMEYCQTCHSYQFDNKFVHGPIPVGGCSACHDFASEPHRYELNTFGADLCFTCHADVQEQFARDSVHGPVAMGMCVVCHSPHGSGFKFQLHDPQGTLCVSCHEEMREKVSRFVVHRPIMEERCSGCHDPHSSDNPRYFLKGVGKELCLRCHPERQMAGHSHPTEGPPPALAPGMELSDKGELFCGSCHDPHSADEQKLFTVSGGCNGCHDALQKTGQPAAEEEEAGAVEEAPAEEPAEEERLMPRRRPRRR